MDKASGFPSFPRDLFLALKEAGPQGAKLRFILLDGGVVAAVSIAKEMEEGLLIETDAGTTTAVPWHAILRVEVERPGAGKSVGFLRG